MQEDRRNTVTLVLGGVRSGKSRYAQQRGEQADRVLFIATAPAPESDANADPEMRAKIERHRADRPAHWTTIEEPLDLPRVLAEHGPAHDLALVDCLTLFVANLLHATDDESATPDRIERHITALCAALAAAPCPVVLSPTRSAAA